MSALTQTTLAAAPTFIPQTELSPEAAAALETASEAYTSGDLLTAHAALSDFFSGQRFEIRSLPEANMATDLLSLCERSYDYHCGDQTRKGLSDYYYNVLNGKHGEVEDAVYSALFMRWSFVSQTASRTYFQSAPSMARDAIKNRRLDHVEEFAEAEPNVFIDRRVLLTDLYLLTGDRVKARQTIEGALAALLSVQTPSQDPFIFLTKTIEVLERLWMLNEHQRMTKFVKILSPAAEQYLPESSPELFRFRALQSVVALESGDAREALRYARLQRSFLERVKLTEAMRQEWTYAAASAEWSAALLLGDEASANQAMQSIEETFEVDRSKPLTRIENEGQATALSLSGISRFMFGHRITERERQLLARYRKNVKSTTDFGLADYIDLLLFFDSVDDRTTTTKIISESKAFLERVQKIGTRDSFDHIAKPLIEVRIATAIFLRIIAERLNDNAEAVDLAISLVDISTRKTNSNDTATAALLSLAKTEEEKFIVRQGFNFIHKKNDFELSRIERIASELTSTIREQDWRDVPSGQMPPLHPDLKQHFIFGDYYRKLQKWRDSLRDSPTLNSAAYMATRARVASTLRETDAALLVSPTPDDSVYLVCVRNREIGSVKRTSLGARALRSLDKSVSLALTATHSPDVTLDSQFPVTESRRLYEELVAPVLPCIGDATHLIVSVQPDFILTPFSSFLTADPQQSLLGYDLRTAPWLVKRMSVSQQWSPLGLAFPIERKGRGEEKRMAFLGVGDPVLSPIDSPATPIMARIRGAGKQGEMVVLRELPETSEELSNIAKTFSGSSELLVRENGTEADLRDRLLSAYRYISFATHGVLREEYQGLSEPALLLTQMGDGDDYSDGLLTASEIGDLDLDADVVSLTACNSASYDLKEFSVGLPSLASAFLVAGARQVLGTRWAVESGTASKIAENFYAALARNPNQRIEDALQLAQLDFIKNVSSTAFTHPRFWAAFSLYGVHVVGGSNLKDAETETTVEEVRSSRQVSEIVSALKIPDIDTQIGVAIGPADLISQRHPQQLVELSKNGIKILFQKDGRYFFRSIVVAGGRSVLTLSGMFLPSTETTAITLSEFTIDGSLVTEQALPIDGLFIQSANLTTLRDGSFLVIAVGYQPKGTSKLLAIRLNSKFDVIESTNVELRDGMSANFVSVQYLDDEILVAVGNAVDSSKKNNPAPLELVDHPLKTLHGCATRHSSLVFGLSVKNFTFVRHFDVQDLMISSVASMPNGDLYAAAAKGNCFGDESVTVGKLTKSNFEPLFTDSVGIDTIPTKIVANDDDELIVIGNSTKLIDSTRKSWSPNDPSIEKYLQPPKIVEEKSFLTFFRLSRKGALIDRKQVTTGDSLFWSDIYRVGNNQYRIVGGDAIRGGSVSMDVQTR